MGTHPIFESDFDCLTEKKWRPERQTTASSNTVNLSRLCRIQKSSRRRVRNLNQVSANQASRNFILGKEQMLDKRLEDAQARESGICPARREIYSELLDELIRQIAIGNPELAGLLVTIRDEINMSLAGYETIFNSANSFGALKALKAELGKVEKRDEVNQLQAKADNYKKEISELKAQLESVSRREHEEKDALVRRQNEELSFLKRNNTQLKSQVDNIMSS